MTKIRILILEDNLQLLKEIEHYFYKNNNIEIVYKAIDGIEGLNYAKFNNENYDLILLDLVMPKKDGLYVLEEMEKEKIQKPVIVISSYNKDEIIAKLMKYNIKYFISKPYFFEDLEKRILDIFTRTTSNVNKRHLFHIYINNFLHEMGIPSHIKGYTYIKESVFLLCKSKKYKKQLYYFLSKKHQKTESSIERAIRHAIEIGFDRGDYKLINKVFGHSVDRNKSKPANIEFLLAITEKIKLEYKNFLC